MQKFLKFGVPLGVTAALLALGAHPAAAQTPGVVISQVYGGGGSTSTTNVPSYKYDFIELYNNSTSQVNLASYSLQYFSAAGTTPAGTNVLQGTIDAGGYYLVREGNPAANVTGADLTNYNDVGVLNLAAAAGKVGLANNSSAITFTTTAGVTTFSANTLDFVGYGTTPTVYEGTGPAPAPSITTSDARTLVGTAGQGGVYTDTNNNATDFTIANPPNPHTGAYVYVAPAPEPSGFVVMCFGAGALGLLVARRRSGTKMIR